MHIILVEDDAQLGDAIRRALERLTYTISWFRDGNEALEASLYGPEAVMSTSALEVLVHALRRKLSHDAIQTVRGFGYMIPREPK